MRMRHEWWKICLTAVIRMCTLCKHIFASAERKFNTVIPSLCDTILIRIYTDARVFKNIKWRDVDKKIRLLEFYVFENVTVYMSDESFSWNNYVHNCRKINFEKWYSFVIKHRKKAYQMHQKISFLTSMHALTPVSLQVTPLHYC